MQRAVGPRLPHGAGRDNHDWSANHPCPRMVRGAVAQTGGTELKVERDKHSTHGRRGAHLRRPTALTIPGVSQPLTRHLPGQIPRRWGLHTLALAAALAFLLSGGVDPAGAQTPTPRVLVSNFDQTQHAGVHLRNRDPSNPADVQHTAAAQAFTTGASPGGYSLSDIELRLRYSTGNNLPVVTLRRSEVGATLATLTAPSTTTTSFSDQDIAFAPPSAVTLAANTTYWIRVERGGSTIRATTATATGEDDDSADGWSIVNRSEYRSTDSTSFTGSQRPLKIQVKGTIIPVQGNPTITGRFAEGETLTADTSTITDFNGLTSPSYTYRWARVDASASATDISGATGSSYTVVRADSGHRLRVTVSFTDDANNTETRTVATSYIPPRPLNDRTLVDTTVVPTTGRTGLQRGLAVSFTPGGTVGTRYRVKEVLWNFPDSSSTGSDTLNFSLYTADSNGHPVQSVARLNNPERERYSGSYTFTAPAGESIVVEAGTRYALVAYDGAEDALACNTRSSPGPDSLPGWTIGDRTHFLTTSETTVASAFYDEPCVFRIRGQHIPPRITGMEVTSRPGRHTGSYLTGSVIAVSVRMSEAVTFDTMSEAVAFDGPSPVLGITIGDNVRDAAYSPPDSTPTEWVFKYTVQSSDEDSDGKITIEENALRGYAAAYFSHNKLEQEGTVNPRASVESVRVSSTPLVPNWYGPGETIQFTARFTLPVRVEGDPQFGFDSGTPTGDELAEFVRVSEDGRDVIFEYEIGTTEEDTDGIWIWDQTRSFRLDGDDGIVAASDGRDAVLTHSELGAQDSHRITQTPRVVSIEVTSDPAHGTNSDYYYRGNKIEFTATFNQPVTVTGDPEFGFSITPAQRVERASYLRGSGTTRLVFDYEVQAADTDDDGIWIGDETRTFMLDTDDAIRGTNNSLGANFSHRELGTQGGHKVDGSMSPAANSVATGAPSITVPDELIVPARLSVDLTGITDANGTNNIANNATYNWQRFAADGTTLVEDGIGTGPTYDLTHYDGNRKIKVQVYFTDDEGHSEGPLTSAATDEISVALVSNIGAGRSVQGGPTLSDGSAGQSPLAAAQAFTTGPSPDWYTLTRIEMELLYNFGDDLPQVTLHRGSPAGDPIATFTAPASTSPDNDYQFVEFTPPSPVLLVSNTDYWVVLAGGGSVVVWAQSTDDDDGSAAGWSVADVSQGRAVDGTEFSDGSLPLRLRVYGYTGGRPANVPHTGAPTIAAANNVFRVPAELLIDISDIMDDNGTINFNDNATYTWKRYSSDGTTFESNIGTEATYTLTADDVGKTIKVDVTFKDDDEYTETPDPSPATAAITAAATCAAPTLTGGAVQLWSAKLRLAFSGVPNAMDPAIFDSISHYGYTNVSRTGVRSIHSSAITLDEVVYHTVVNVSEEIERPGKSDQSRTFEIWLTTPFSDATRSQLAAYVCDQSFLLDASSYALESALHTYSWTSPSIDWSTHAQRTVYITRDQVAPTIESATANGASLVITFNEDLDEDATLPTSAFTVKKTAGTTETTQNPTGVSISGKKVTLTLGTAVTATDTAVKVTYTKPPSGSDNKLADDFGNEVANFTDQGVVNQLADDDPPAISTTTPPTLVAAGKTLTITYDETLDGGSTPDKTAFQVMATPAGGSPTSFTPTAVSISGAQVSLTFDKPFAHNDALTVTYTKPSANPIQDPADNDAPEFTTLDVTNTSTIPRVSITAVRTEATPILNDPEFRITLSRAGGSGSLTLDVTQTDEYYEAVRFRNFVPLSVISSSQMNLGSHILDLRDFVRTVGPHLYSSNTTGTLTLKIKATDNYLPALAPNNEAEVAIRVPPMGKPVIVDFVNASPTVTEGDPARLQLRFRTGETVVKPRRGVPLRIRTSGGSAMPGTDYEPVEASFLARVDEADWSLTDGRYEAVRVVNVQTSENDRHEAAEQFSAMPIIHSLHTEISNALDLTATATITIRDDDPLALDDVTVDSTPPNTSSTNVAYYDQGDTITFHLAFNGSVTVAGTGTPSFSFLLGSNTRQATYLSGSGTDTLVFTYTVVADDNDHDGISWPTGTVALNGATIRFTHTDTAEQVDAVLTYDAQAALTAQKVDSAKPTLEPPIILLRDKLTLVYDQDLNTTAPANGAFTVTVDGTTNAVTAVAISGKMVDLTLTTEVTDEDATVTVTYVKPSTNPIQDPIGREADAFSNQPVTVETNPRPTSADATAPVIEDTPYAFPSSLFTFMDPENDAFHSIIVVTLPSKGALRFDGNPATAGQQVTVAQLDDGDLVYQPPPHLYGNAADTFTFRVVDANTRPSTLAHTMTINIAARPDPAGGKPTITGVARVERTLTASVSQVTDPDGLPAPADFTYQWKRYAADGNTFRANVGTNSSTYTLVAADEDHKIRVEVTFTDLTGDPSGPLLSDPYPDMGTVGEVSDGPVIIPQREFRVGDGLSVDLSDIEDPDGVTEMPGNARYTWQRFDATGTTLERDGIGIGPTYLLTPDDQGRTIRVQVRFTDDARNMEGPLASPATPVIAASRHTAPSAMVSNLDQPETNTGLLTTRFETAFSFTTGSNVAGYYLGSVVLRLASPSLPHGSDPPTVRVVQDDNGSPTGTEAATFAGAPNVTVYERDYVFTPEHNAGLLPSTVYWVVVSGGDGAWRLTGSGAEDPSSNAGWSLGSVIRSRDAGASQDFRQQDGQLMMRVNAFAVNGPAIIVSNVFRVPAELGVDLRGITDDDGVNNIAANATYNWQRYGPDGTTPEPGSIGTGPTYRLTDADAGRRIGVQVRYTDDANNPEGPLASLPTDVIVPAAACPAPAYVGGAIQIWTGRLSVGRIETGTGVLYGFRYCGLGVLLDDLAFTADSAHNIDAAEFNGRDDTLTLALGSGLSGTEKLQLALHVCGTPFALNSAEAGSGNGTFTWNDPGIDWSEHAERSLYLSRDQAAPTLSVVSVQDTNKKLALTFNEDLGDATLSNDAFTVTVTPPGQPGGDGPARQQRAP